MAPPASDRGYGREHQELRARLLPHAYGQPCTRCGREMVEGQALDLDHTDDRTGYAGFAHAFCNRQAGGRRGRAAQLGRQPEAVPVGTPQPSRDW